MPRVLLHPMEKLLFLGLEKKKVYLTIYQDIRCIGKLVLMALILRQQRKIANQLISTRIGQREQEVR